MGPQVTPSLPFLPLPLGSVILLEDILILHAFYFTLLFSSTRHRFEHRTELTGSLRRQFWELRCIFFPALGADRFVHPLGVFPVWALLGLMVCALSSMLLLRLLPVFLFLPICLFLPLRLCAAACPFPLRSLPRAVCLRVSPWDGGSHRWDSLCQIQQERYHVGAVLYARLESVAF